MATPYVDTQTSLTVEEARERIAQALTPVEGWETVTVRSALGRVLYSDVIAPFDVPAHDNSAMDGYAVRAADLAAGGETELTVVGTAFAGGAFSGSVGPGQAVRVMTGAVMPRGSDTVVVQEVVKTEGNRVFVPAGQKAGQNLRRAGEDLTAGQPALPAGKRVGPAELGLIASLGYGEVQVRRHLRVAFFSTGDELASIGKPLAPGEVYDSNRYTLFGMLSCLGVEILDMGVVRDDPEAMEKAFCTAAAQADVILTSGGVSVGDADFVKDMAARLGEVGFWKIAIKPGRPMAFGRIRDTWLFGLPGNPVAVMVTYLQIVQDALQTLMGITPAPKPVFQVPAAFSMKKHPGRREFPRGELFLDGGQWKVRLAGQQGSGVLRSMSDANCLVILPETQGNVSEGELVGVQPFEGLY